jgi:hypothetical protein
VAVVRGRIKLSAEIDAKKPAVTHHRIFSLFTSLRWLLADNLKNVAADLIFNARSEYCIRANDLQRRWGSCTEAWSASGGV